MIKQEEQGVHTVSDFITQTVAFYRPTLYSYCQFGSCDPHDVTSHHFSLSLMYNSHLPVHYISIGIIYVYGTL